MGIRHHDGYWHLKERQCWKIAFLFRRYCLCLSSTKFRKFQILQYRVDRNKNILHRSHQWQRKIRHHQKWGWLLQWLTCIRWRKISVLLHTDWKCYGRGNSMGSHWYTDQAKALYTNDSHQCTWRTLSNIIHRCIWGQYYEPCLVLNRSHSNAWRVMVLDWGINLGKKIETAREWRSLQSRYF